MKTFEEYIEDLKENRDDIVDRDALKAFAIDYINNDNEFVAIHILEALRDSDAEYFNYDYCMGTLNTPTPLETIKDLEEYIEK